MILSLYIIALIAGIMKVVCSKLVVLRMEHLFARIVTRLVFMTAKRKKHTMQK